MLRKFPTMHWTGDHHKLLPFKDEEKSAREEFTQKLLHHYMVLGVCSPALVDEGPQQGNKGGSPELIALSKYLTLGRIKICAKGDARFVLLAMRDLCFLKYKICAF